MAGFRGRRIQISRQAWLEVPPNVDRLSQRVEKAIESIHIVMATDRLRTPNTGISSRVGTGLLAMNRPFIKRSQRDHHLCLRIWSTGVIRFDHTMAYRSLASARSGLAEDPGAHLRHGRCGRSAPPDENVVLDPGPGSDLSSRGRGSRSR